MLTSSSSSALPLSSAIIPSWQSGSNGYADDDGGSMVAGGEHILKIIIIISIVNNQWSQRGCTVHRVHIRVTNVI